MNMFWSSVLSLIVGLLIGGALGFYFTKKKFEKELKENPPVNEKMIRAMFMQMGRKPSEAQIKAVMRSMGQK
ncbi:MAG: YneF family protein [Firmicutes bacterium]|nr:YneF family protein [Bacillota bacterium]MDD7227876.1 YneF family protein [Bacillota bacterium]MDY5997546.1 YneF family protein [Erysipelotrichaceae bacterium]